MTAYFFDTSALLKRYVIESGTAWVLGAADPQNGHLIFIAQITSVEITSGIARLQREGAISVTIAQSAEALLERHIRRQYKTISFTNQVAQRAKNLLKTYPLRAYDAIQLASALEANGKLTAGGLQLLVFVSGDTRLLSAAVGEGLSTHRPT